jgi:molecular chaperone GrpE
MPVFGKSFNSKQELSSGMTKAKRSTRSKAKAAVETPVETPVEAPAPEIEVITVEPEVILPPVEDQAAQQELAEARAKADEYLEGWRRSQADFSNYKRRIEREQSQVYQNAAGNVIKRYLGILDDLDRALKNRPSQGDGAAWADGIELIYRKFQAILESEGIKPMDAQGQQFDPNFHEAILSEDNDQYESGQIIDVLQQGYMLGERVLRPAMVRVAR